MYVLDTDIVIWILREDRRIISAISKIVGKGTTGISTITIAEVYKFAFASEFSMIEEFIDQQQIFPVSADIAKESGLYWQQFHKKLLNLSVIDCIIAATAKAYKANLLTLNTRHFPMLDIKIKNPLKI